MCLFEWAIVWCVCVLWFVFRSFRSWWEQRKKEWMPRFYTSIYLYCVEATTKRKIGPHLSVIHLKSLILLFSIEKIDGIIIILFAKNARLSLWAWYSSKEKWWWLLLLLTLQQIFFEFSWAVTWLGYYYLQLKSQLNNVRMKRWRKNPTKCMKQKEKKQKWRKRKKSYESS